MSDDTRPDDEMRQRALGAILTDAFFTWPSAVTIGLTIIMFFSRIELFPGWQPWYWILAGLVLEVIYLVATLTDPAARQQAVARMLTEQYDPRDIKNFSARQKLQKALEYKRSIDDFVTKESGALKVALSNTAEEINDWIALIYRLAQNIDRFEENKIIDRDRRAVPTELQSLERRMKIENDPSVRAELQSAIDIRKRLLQDLRNIESVIKRTEIQMDNTVAQLSTVYAQMQLLDAKELDSGRAKRLQEAIHEEVASLSDIVQSMDDVYSSGGYAGALRNLESESTDAAEDESSDIAQDSTSTRRSAGRQQ